MPDFCIKLPDWQYFMNRWANWLDKIFYSIAKKVWWVKMWNVEVYENRHLVLEKVYIYGKCTSYEWQTPCARKGGVADIQALNDGHFVLQKVEMGIF